MIMFTGISGRDVASDSGRPPPRFNARLRKPANRQKRSARPSLHQQAVVAMILEIAPCDLSPDLVG
jgi:hypothetical protein